MCNIRYLYHNHDIDSNIEICYVSKCYQTINPVTTFNSIFKIYGSGNPNCISYQNNSLKFSQLLAVNCNGKYYVNNSVDSLLQPTDDRYYYLLVIRQFDCYYRHPPPSAFVIYNTLIPYDIIIIVLKYFS